MGIEDGAMEAWGRHGLGLGPGGVPRFQGD
jgi:hypothetical protein